jgi:hypothetical protein
MSFKADDAVCLSWHQGWHMCLRPRQSSDLMLHFISISTIHPVFRAGRSHFLFRARLNVPVPIQMPLKVWLFQWWYLQQR